MVDNYTGVQPDGRESQWMCACKDSPMYDFMIKAMSGCPHGSHPRRLDNLYEHDYQRRAVFFCET